MFNLLFHHFDNKMFFRAAVFSNISDYTDVGEAAVRCYQKCFSRSMFYTLAWGGEVLP